MYTKKKNTSPICIPTMQAKTSNNTPSCTNVTSFIRGMIEKDQESMAAGEMKIANHHTDHIIMTVTELRDFDPPPPHNILEVIKCINTNLSGCTIPGRTTRKKLILRS